MKSYTFKVVMEKDKWPDEPDDQAVWRIYVPGLEAKGAASWGHTQQEAIDNIHVALQMVLEEMIADGESIPSESIVVESADPLVTVTLS